MFYSGIEKAGDQQSGSQVIVIETVWWFFLWCILEAFALEGIVDFTRRSFNKTENLFESLNMDFVAIALDWVSHPLIYLDFAGTGDLKDWLGRALILWACTGLPMLIWRGSKMEGRHRHRNQ